MVVRPIGVDDGPEFALVQVEVSHDGVNYTPIAPSQPMVVAIPGDDEGFDEDHVRSYDLSGTGLAEVRSIRVVGLDMQAAGGMNGFE